MGTYGHEGGYAFNEDQRSAEPDMKCPHCGKQFWPAALVGSLIPTHDYPPPCRAVCPGSQQVPRHISDRRPLWKDDPDAKA